MLTDLFPACITVHGRPNYQRIFTFYMDLTGQLRGGPDLLAGASLGRLGQISLPSPLTCITK